MTRAFIGRKHELELLDDLSQRRGAKFLIVYGRRRIGKTRLLTYWAEARAKDVLYWVATQTSSASLLAHFSQAVHSHLHPDQPMDQRFTYGTWEAALQVIADQARTKPFVLIIDEFTYAMGAVPELPSLLQTFWDQHFKDTELFLIISGSQLHMMQEEMHSARSPLYGRATARLNLRPLPYGSLTQFFPSYEPDALVAVYAILGGIPAYLEMFDPSVSLSENIRNVLLTPNSLLQADTLLFLHEQFEEPRNYAAIMEAIAHNKRTRAEIVAYTELPPAHTGRYLNTLVELSIVERRVPITTKATMDSRKGRYYLIDPYLRFYFRFIAPRLDQIERYRTAQALEYVKQNLRPFVGEHAFEALCRDWVGYVGDKGQLQFYPERIGGYWGKDAQLDILALNEQTKQVLIGECKWGADLVDEAVIHKLLTQAPKALSHLKEVPKWKPHLYLFTRMGVTPAAEQLAADRRVRVITLQDIHNDLRHDL